MFDSLNDRLSGLFDRLSGRGVLSEKDVDEALREVRVALLEADVALPVVRQFMARAKELATGEAIIKAVKPADQVVKIVYDGLIDMLGGEEPVPVNLAAVPPVVILMAGLQGSGKTTTSAKLALRLTKFDRKKVMMASLDTRRPAAMEQLKLLGEQTGVDVLPIVAGQGPADITRRALQSAKLQGYDVLILDTAGRTTLDEALMAEAAEIAKISNPTETFLVADSLTGQDAVRTATAFHERLPLTGLILTRADGDGRGGAMLSMRAVTDDMLTLLAIHGVKPPAEQKVSPFWWLWPDKCLVYRDFTVGELKALAKSKVWPADAYSYEPIPLTQKLTSLTVMLVLAGLVLGIAALLVFWLVHWLKA